MKIITININEKDLQRFKRKFPTVNLSAWVREKITEALENTK